MAQGFIINRRGNASIEFVWAVIVLVPVLLFIFQIFQSTMHGSGGLVKSRLAAFSSLDRTSSGEPQSIVYSDAATDSHGQPYNCADDCANKLNYTFTGPMRTYPYGIESFDMQVRRSFVVNLQ